VNKSTISLALQVAQLLNEHSESEVHDAVELLRKHGYSGALLEYLSGRNLPAKRTNRSDAVLSTPKSIQEIKSRAVVRLKEKDPKKFQILSEFDSLVKRGQLLPTHEDLRRFGELISKDFEPKKARKETIGSLIAFLAELSVDKIEELVKAAASFGTSGSDDEYQRLARFLIKGKEAVPEGYPEKTDLDEKS